MSVRTTTASIVTEGLLGSGQRQSFQNCLLFITKEPVYNDSGNSVRALTWRRKDLENVPEPSATRLLDIGNMQLLAIIVDDGNIEYVKLASPRANIVVLLLVMKTFLSGVGSVSKDRV